MGAIDNILGYMKLNQDSGYDDIEDGGYSTISSEDYPEDSGERQGMFQSRRQRSSGRSYEDSPSSRRRAGDGMEVCVLKPTTVDEAREITDTLVSNRTVLLNLEGLDSDIAQRIIDFASGSSYAIRGNLQKISHYIFLITPASVKINGDMQDYINGSI